MNRKVSRFPISRVRSTTALVILLAIGFAAPHVYADTPWEVVHLRDLQDTKHGSGLMHFIDAGTGWAYAGQPPLITLDGGQTWQLREAPDPPIGYRMHFISPTTGWRLGIPAHEEPEPLLSDDIRFLHTTDGGLMWQLRHGKVTEVTWHGEAEPIPPVETGQRLGSTHIHFVDERFGWIIGYTGHWTERAEGEELRWLGGSFFCSTRDTGETWKCQVHPYLWYGIKGDEPQLQAPRGIDFVNPDFGWIAPSEGWIYRTTDGGLTWERTTHPFMIGRGHIHGIDFVEESRGWAIGEGLWVTADGSQSWSRQVAGYFSTGYFADIDEGWVVGVEWLPKTPNQLQLNTYSRIYHTVDGGESWQLEWEGRALIGYIGYHEVTQTAWAGGRYGTILKRTIPTTSVSPRGKLAALWGKLKAGPHTNR